MKKYFSFSLILCCLLFADVSAQDTLRISFQDFINQGLEQSRQLDANKRKIDLAENRVSRAKMNRILPSIELSTAHGLIPGVYSPDGNPSGQLYLDPNLENDWENWAVFTQGEISALQPILTWGAISKAIQAARSGAEAAVFEYKSEEQKYIMQLTELYYARLFSMELERLIDDARSTLNQAERQLENMREEGDPDLEEADVYQFYIFKYEFEMQVDEVRENSKFLNNAWKIALGIDNNVTLLPQINFLDPLNSDIRGVAFYEQQALMQRNELLGLEAAGRAADYGKEIAQTAFYPTLFLGLNARLAYTPNRPRQTNPFIRNTTNYQSLAFGFTFRQNLNFSQNRNQLQRADLQAKQVREFRDAAADGIRLEVNDRYRDVRIAESRLLNTEKAYQMSNEWLRNEQIDYDLGFGDVKNLVDAVKKNLELEVTYKQRIHEYNLRMARLWHASGLSLEELE